MPPAAAQQARTLREGGDGRRQKGRRVLMRGDAKIQGRRAVREPFALRRRSCGCRGLALARAAGMQGTAAMKRPFLPPPLPPPSAPPAMPRPVGLAGGREKDGRRHARGRAPPLQAGGARERARRACRLCGARACRRPGPRRGRRLAPGDGSRAKRAGRARRAALEDGASCGGGEGGGTGHAARRIPGRSGRGPARSAPRARGTRAARAWPLPPRAAGRFRARPRMPARRQPASVEGAKARDHAALHVMPCTGQGPRLGALRTTFALAGAGTGGICCRRRGPFSSSPLPRRPPRGGADSGEPALPARPAAERP